MFKASKKQAQAPGDSQNKGGYIKEYGFDVEFSYPSREEAKAAILAKINEFLAPGSNALDKDSEPDFLRGEIRDYIEESLKDLNRQRYQMAMKIKQTKLKNDRAIDRCLEEMGTIKKEIDECEKKKSDKGFFSKYLSSKGKRD